MLHLNLKPEGFLYDKLEHLDCWLCWVPYPDNGTDGQAPGYCQQASLTEKRPWHGMCTPHGYLNFKGVPWSVKAINLNMWLLYHLFELNN